jgi:hypothetical protein
MNRAVASSKRALHQKLLLQSLQDGRDDIVRQILHLHEGEADVQDDSGRARLSHAAEKNHLNIIRILSGSNANRDFIDSRGERLVDYAQRLGEQTHKNFMHRLDVRS